MHTRNKSGWLVRLNESVIRSERLNTAEGLRPTRIDSVPRQNNNKAISQTSRPLISMTLQVSPKGLNSLRDTHKDCKD